MKVRTLVTAAALAGAAAGATMATPATAWECPKNLTRPYYVTTPAGQHRVCVPGFSCETCYGDVKS